MNTSRKGIALPPRAREYPTVKDANFDSNFELELLFTEDKIPVHMALAYGKAVSQEYYHLICHLRETE